jgi:hypothetical protein
MNYPLHDLIGNLGVVLIVGSYFLVQIGKMSATGIAYTSSNGLGAVLVMYSLYFDFNLSSFIIEVFWLLISLIGLARIYFERRRKGNQ